MRRLISIAVVVLVCAGAAVLVAASGDETKGSSYKIVFDNAFGLTEGGDFRIGGVNAGATTEFEATKDSPPKAQVTAEITEPGFGAFRSDATCNIKPQSLIGEYFVDCQPGTSKEKLKDGATVPVDQTESTIPQDLVNNILRRPYRERLRLIINELGTGLAGRPDDLQEVLKRAHPGLRETSKVLKILGDQNTVIENFVKDSDTVVAQLEARKEEVSRFIVEAGETAEISATRREELRRTFNKLPGFLGELEPTMARLEDLADQQIPLLRDARRAAPDLDAVLTLLGPFSEASRPAVRSLGEAAEVGARAFEKGANEVRELRALAREAPGTAKPLRQLLASLDDRRRAIDSDPRAAVNGPPANDPSTNRGKTTGFTGLEAVWNYFFWQGLSINGFDDLSHILRISVVLSEGEEGCSPYENDTPQRNPALAEKFRQCNQYLGPNQPGVYTPDFTRGANAASIAREAGRPARKVGERRKEGQPDAGPLPGQKDLSKPQITLPPQLKELIDRLPKLPTTGTERLDQLLQGERPLPGAGGQQDANQLLDFLLAP